jgi:uncharacterized damage-inducible protein DinB
MDLLDRLLKHDRWATDQLLVMSRGLTDAQLDQEFDVGHRTLRETFQHMIFNIEAWTDIIEGQPMQVERGEPSLAALSDRHQRAHDEFAALARRVRADDLMEETFVDHFGERMRYGGAIVHVVLHNAEHRTEALHILSRLDLPEVPEVDHGLWDHVSRGA